MASVTDPALHLFIFFKTNFHLFLKLFLECFHIHPLVCFCALFCGTVAELSSWNSVASMPQILAL